MSDNETVDLVAELKAFVESVQAMESADRGPAFTTFFSLERIENMAAQWRDNEFQFEALLTQLG